MWNDQKKEISPLFLKRWFHQDITHRFLGFAGYLDEKVLVIPQLV